MLLGELVSLTKQGITASAWGNKGSHNILFVDKDRLDEALIELAKNAEAEGYKRCQANHKKKVLT